MPLCRVLTVASLLTLTAGCSRSPVAPTAPPPAPVSLSGSWVGSYVLVCPSSPNCGRVAGGAPADPQPFALLLNQNGTILTGQINLGGWLPRVANVTGSVTDDGVMTLEGGMAWPAQDFCVPAGGWHLTSWNARVGPRSSGITGAFSFVTQKHLSSCYYMQDLQVNATIVSLTPGTLAEPTFAGHWQGSAVQTNCRTVGWQFCYPSLPANGFDLRLTQSGAAVTGTIGAAAGLPVTGSVAGDTLRLEARRETPVSGATEITRLMDWNTRQDSIGRLIGSYRYAVDVTWNAGPNAGETWSTMYDIELQNVVRVPW